MNSILNKYLNFGVLEVCKNTVKVFESNIRHATITLNREVMDARWAGENIVVYLKDGSVRKYTSLSQYQNIR